MLLPGFSQLAAQATRTDRTGSISGRVVDIATGAGLPDVGIAVDGRPGMGATTGLDGKYSISNIPSGTVSIQARRIGYNPKLVTGIQLGPGATFTQDITLEQIGIVLQTTLVTASAERGNVREALSVMREAPTVSSHITAEQISRSADGDAAAAAQRVSGLTIRDGKFPNARGQQPRATVAMINHARIPSPEPEIKAVPFDLFPTSLIRSIEVVKSFTPDQPGDFSGALVNIQTKEFPSEKTVTYSTSFGVNTAAVGESVLTAPVSPSEWLAIASGGRRLPAIVRQAGNLGDRFYSQSEINQLIGSFRNSWSPSLRGGNPNSSFGMSVGGNDLILGRQIGYIGSITYSMSQEVRSNEERALIDFGTGNTPANEFSGSTGRSSVLWGGILNASTFLGDNTVITMNNMYNRTSDSEAHSDVGTDENYGRQNILERTSLSYVERSVRSNQITGQHTFDSRSVLDWSLTSSATTRREPDRSDMVYISSINPADGSRRPFELFTASSDGARRTFADLSEGSWNLATNARIHLGDAVSDNEIRFGALLRTTNRDAEVLQYSFATLSPLPEDDARRPAEEIFDGRFTQGGEAVFTLNPLAQSGSYKASDLLAAGFVMAGYALGEHVSLVGGARLEYSHVKVTTTNLFGLDEPVTRNFADVLPSLGVKVTLTNNQQLRFSAARTLARPEYRELSPILNRDVLGGQGFRGDTALVRALINNFDARWEWYPNPGELVAVAVFAKQHQRPIERIEVPTSGTSILSFVNAESARNFGVELEVRKELGNIAPVLTPFTVFGNLTLMSSEIRLGENNAASATNANRPLVGQAPYVLNAGLSYAAFDDRWNATVLYNRVGKRIDAAGPAPLPDIYELPRDVLDFSLRAPVLGALDAKLDIRNILDAPYELRQGAVTRLSYTTGRILSVGLTWKP
jgi:hypothetical protein